MRILRPLIAMCAAFGFVSARAPVQPNPGEGVLCLGVMIYFVEEQGRTCFAAQDPEFQSRIAGYAERFDGYILRNSSLDEKGLADFKRDQNLGTETKEWVCQGGDYDFYTNFRAQPKAEFDKAVDDLLMRDGPPTFGDCL